MYQLHVSAIILAIIGFVSTLASNYTIFAVYIGDEISFTIVRLYNLNFITWDRKSCYKVLNSEGYFAIMGRVEVHCTLLWFCFLCDVGFFLS